MSTSTGKTAAIKKAIAAGRREAKIALARRDAVPLRRAAKLKGIREPVSMQIKSASFAGTITAAYSGILVAEGDSWFDYPFHDVLKDLEDDYGYEVESVAHKGDSVEEMAYSGGQLDELTRRIEKVIKRGHVPKAILLSGGGNDVAGDAFGMLLNHAKSSIAGFNNSILNGVIDERIFTAYITILSAVNAICKQQLQREVPIIVHGYDYPVPDGRGFMGGWGFLPGPWLEPGFREKGFEPMKQRLNMAVTLIDRFNEMIKRVVQLDAFKNIHYIDLRNTLSSGVNYEDWWANEMHPTKQGFAAVTAKFAKLINQL